MVVASLLRRPRPTRDADAPAAIPRGAVANPRFKEIAEGDLGMVELQCQAPPDEYKYFTRILQAAALDVQNEVLIAEGWTKGATAIIWRQLARAYWRQNWRLALLVVSQNKWARELVKVNEQEKTVEITDYAEVPEKVHPRPKEGSHRAAAGAGRRSVTGDG